MDQGDDTGVSRADPIRDLVEERKRLLEALDGEEFSVNYKPRTVAGLRRAAKERGKGN